MTNTRIAPHAHEPAPTAERRLQILVVGHELRVEALELLLSRHQDLQVQTVLIDALSPVDTVMSVIERRRVSRPFDAVLIDWDGETFVNMAVLTAVAKVRQRSLVVTSSMLPSDLDALQKAGTWGYVLTTASSRHLYAAIDQVAQGRKVFPLVQITTLPKLRIKRQLVFYPELVEMVASEQGFDLTPLSLQILAHLSEVNAVKIGARIDRQQGTIRTELSTTVFPFLRMVARHYRLPTTQVRNQKEAFVVTLMLGFFEFH